jgi:hypothetical protein
MARGRGSHSQSDPAHKLLEPRISPQAIEGGVDLQVNKEEVVAREAVLQPPHGNIGAASGKSDCCGAAPWGRRRPVRAGYALKKDGGFGFDPGRYDQVIDPVLVYSTYYGGVSLHFSSTDPTYWWWGRDGKRTPGDHSD